MTLVSTFHANGQLDQARAFENYGRFVWKTHELKAAAERSAKHASMQAEAERTHATLKGAQKDVAAQLIACRQAFIALLETPTTDVSALAQESEKRTAEMATIATRILTLHQEEQSCIAAIHEAHSLAPPPMERLTQRLHAHNVYDLEMHKVLKTRYALGTPEWLALECLPQGESHIAHQRERDAKREQHMMLTPDIYSLTDDPDSPYFSAAVVRTDEDEDERPPPRKKRAPRKQKQQPVKE